LPDGPRHGRQGALEQGNAPNQDDQADDDEESADAAKGDIQAVVQLEDMEQESHAKADSDKDEKCPDHDENGGGRIAPDDIADPAAQISAVGFQLASSGSVCGNRFVKGHAVRPQKKAWCQPKALGRLRIILL